MYPPQVFEQSLFLFFVSAGPRLPPGLRGPLPVFFAVRLARSHGQLLQGGEGGAGA